MKNLRFRSFVFFPTLATIVLALASCEKHHACFDRALYKKQKGKPCLQDCPGVVGCDGETYCNECVAASKGIRVVP